MSADELEALACTPLKALSPFVTRSTRAGRGLGPVDGKLAALGGIATHNAAGTAVAQSMLSRMTKDVQAFADSANGANTPRMLGLEDADVADYFSSSSGSGSDSGGGESTGQHAALTTARARLDDVLQGLKAIRDSDAWAINDAVPMLKHTANFVDVHAAAPKTAARAAATLFRYGALFACLNCLPVSTVCLSQLTTSATLYQPQAGRQTGPRGVGGVPLRVNTV